jgi:hypothetical protein
MSDEAPSPLITHLSWGRLEVAGGRRFKDAKLFPGGSREWDWSETGTDHVPGIQSEDVEELLEHGDKRDRGSFCQNRKLAHGTGRAATPADFAGREQRDFCGHRQTNPLATFV